jgi:transposase InsO family protein
MYCRIGFSRKLTDDGWLYVAAVLDLFSGRLVGWVADHL